MTAELDVTATLADRLGRDQVFGPVAERGGTTVVPVARVRASSGSTMRGPLLAGGAGTSVVAQPAGAFVISTDGKVSWHPAVDVNRIVLGGQIVFGAIIVLGIALRGLVRRG